MNLLSTPMGIDYVLIGFDMEVQWNLHERSPLNDSHLPITASV